MNNQSPYARASQSGAPSPARKTSLVGLIAAVVAVALVCTSAVVALVLTLGDDGKDAAATSSQSTESPTEDESSGTPTPDANAVVGAGYTYQLPGGWSDVTDDAGGLGTDGAIDTVAAWGSRFQGARANLIVTTTTAGSATTPQELEKTWRASLRKELGAKPEVIPGITVDGEEAVGLRFERMNENDVLIVQIAYLAVNDGRAYTLGLSTTPDQESASQDAMDAVVDSWAWN